MLSTQPASTERESPTGIQRTSEIPMSEKSPQKKGAMKQGKTLKEKRADKSAKRDGKKGLMDK